MTDNLKNWRDEMQSAALYRVISAREPVDAYKKMFLLLGKAAEEQAAIWAESLAKKGLRIPARFKPSFRVFVVSQLIRIFGPRKIKPVLAAMKVRGLSVYASNPLLAGGHTMPTTVEEVGRRHRSGGSAGNLRAAVFGVNDGLLSNASLIMGVFGAGADAHTIVVAGMAGVLAGAFSMGAGEYVSVASQKEMMEFQIGLEREELDEYPDEEAAELSLIYQARGLAPDDADRLARQMIADPVKGLDTLAREELGVNPDELMSPWGAAFSSFFAFFVGGIIPLVPFFFQAGTKSLFATIGLAALALFVIGCVLSLFTGRNALWSGARMTAIGAAAGVVTYLLGKVIGSF